MRSPRKYLAFLVATVIVACGISPFSPPDAPAYVVNPANGTSPLINRNAGRCMDVTGGSTANGTAVIIYDCTGGPNQLWTYPAVGANGPVTVYGNKCLTTASTTTNGARLSINKCTGKATQLWQRTAVGELRNVVTDNHMCVDVVNAATANNTPVMLWNCYGSPSQYWDTSVNPVNKPPVAAFTWSCTNLACAFTNTSTDSDGTVASSAWTFGDGATSVSASPTHTYAAAGTYAVGLTVTDNQGATNGVTQSITVAAPVAGIAINPGESFQAKSDSYPTAVTFIVKAGTHVRQSVKPHDGQTFRCEAGAVMDGQAATTYAFRAWNDARWVNNVKIVGCTIVNYTPPAQNGAIWGGDSPTASGTSWVLDSLDVSYATNLGIRIGNRMQVLRTKTHHNGTMGLGGGANAFLIDGVETSYNNNGCPHDPGFESGGSKFTVSDSGVIRNSYAHNNCGPGWWMDIDNIHYLIEASRSDSNAREGIVTEISYAGIIRNNTVRWNGAGDPYRTSGWGWNAGIGIHASPDVEVYGNTVEGNFNGIMGVQQGRGSGKYGLHWLKNLYVHDNIIKQNSVVPTGWQDGAAGVVRDTLLDVFSAAANNRFRHNTYTITAPRTHPFAWADNWRTTAEWLGYGQDSTSTFSP